jgi:hypothetical protein
VRALLAVTADIEVVGEAADAEQAIELAVAERPDMIIGDVTGAAPDRDTFTTPRTKVARSWDVHKSSGSVLLTHTFRNVRDPFYLRLRGTDGNQLAPGLPRASVDPSGPAIDVVGDADPWVDLWFYSNRSGSCRPRRVTDGPVAVITVLGVDAGSGTDGPAVRFPGIELLTGTVPVADVLAGTAIEEVRVLAGGVLPPAAVLQTREFCRPVYEAGTLVLHVLPAGPGRVASFEVPNPTPCCAVHT